MNIKLCIKCFQGQLTMSVTLLALLMALTFVPCREAAVDVCEEIAAIKTQLGMYLCKHIFMSRVT